MQEIRTTERGGGLSRELIDRLVGRESPGLEEAFAKRRSAAVASGKPVAIHEVRRIGRNDPCPCGSGVKFKKCCGRNLAADDTRLKRDPVVGVSRLG